MTETARKTSVSAVSARATRGKDYWKHNLRRLGYLLLVWFLGSYGAAILWVDQLDRLEFFGFKLGFWFAQQGSILVFLVVILSYIRMMNSLDDAFESASEEDGDAEHQAGSEGLAQRTERTEVPS